MSLAILNGLITSIILETLVLLKQMNLKSAINTAFGMSFISMIGMELSMNFTDIILTGGAMLTWWAIPIMLFVGFITPLPYNYYKLKKHNILCSFTKNSTVGITVNNRIPNNTLIKIKSDMFEVQDEGSQLMTLLIEIRANMKILDISGTRVCS